MTVLVQRITGASKATIWLFPLISLSFFMLQYFPIIGRLWIISYGLPNAAILYTGLINPCYDTYKAIEHRKGVSQERMLSYWLVLGLMFILMKILQIFLFKSFIGMIFYIGVLMIKIWDYIISSIVYSIIIRPSINTLRKNYGSLKYKKI